MKRIRLVIIFMACLSSPIYALAVETGTALKTDVIRKEPYSDAQKIGEMVRSEKIQILNKKGAWLNIKTSRTTGWVRLLSVKKGISASGNEVKGVFDVASGRAGTGKVIATTGVRGLNEEELKNAQYNEAEVVKLESYTQSPAQGQQFAKIGGLNPLKLSYLPESRKGGVQ